MGAQYHEAQGQTPEGTRVASGSDERLPGSRSGWRRASRPSSSIVLLAVLTAISFAAIDVRFALAGRISPAYLLDAAAEAVLLFAIGLGWTRARHASSENRGHAA